jgi:hypothetical protein
MNYEFRRIQLLNGINCNTAGVSVNFFVLDFAPSLCIYVLKSPPCSKCLSGKIINSEFSPCVTNVTESPTEIIYLCEKQKEWENSMIS